MRGVQALADTQADQDSGARQTGAHGRFVEDYRQLVDDLIASKPIDEAMTAAIGGQDGFGDLELAILDTYGLAEDSYVIDAGCGSGRLTRRLAKLPKLRYLGTDVNDKLLYYAQTTAKRSDFRYALVDSTRIPEEDGRADFVAFFSVGTHMMNEEFYLYLIDAKRVLKPGGRIVFSFLDIRTPSGKHVLEQTAKVVGAGQRPVHLNVFMGRDDLPTWAELLGMELIDVVPGDTPAFNTTDEIAKVIGRHFFCQALGQSVAVLEKAG